MKLLFVSSEFPPGPGGIGTHAHQLAARLTARGWEVTVLTPQDYAPADEIARFNRSQAFEVETFPKLRFAPFKAVQRYNATCRRLRLGKPDLVVATGKRAVLIVSAALGFSAAPWAAIGHGSEFTVVPRWEQALVTRSYNRASAVIAVSNFTLDLIHACGIRPRRSLVIPNGADEAAFRRLPAREGAAIREAKGFGDDPLLLTVGNVTDRKGQEVVIRAMPAILSRHPRARYAMAGLPTEQPKLQRLAGELGVSGHVHFLGRVPGSELAPLMNAADVLLMTSRRTETGDCEGFGIAAIEAALCGTAAVVSDGSGLSEAVLHEETGLCVPEGDSSAVAEAVCRILGDEPFRRRLESAGEQRARERYNWGEVTATYDAFFRELTGSGAARTRVQQGKLA